MCNSSLTLNCSKHITSYLHPISQLKLCHTVYIWQYDSMSTDNLIGHVIPTCLDSMSYCQVESDLWSCIVGGKSRWKYAKVSWNAWTIIICEVLFHIYSVEMLHHLWLLHEYAFQDSGLWRYNEDREFISTATPTYKINVWMQVGGRESTIWVHVFFHHQPVSLSIP